MKVLVVSDIIINAFLAEDFEDCQKVIDWSRGGRVEGYITEKTLTVIRERRGGTEAEKEIFIQNIRNKIPHIAPETGEASRFLEEVGVACFCAAQQQYDVIVTANDNLYRNELSRISSHVPSHRVRVLLPSELARELDLIPARLKIRRLLIIFLLAALVSAIGIGVLAGLSKILVSFLESRELAGSTVDEECGQRILRSNASNQSLETRDKSSKKKTKEGKAYYDKREYDSAIDSFCEALKFNRNNPEAVIHLNNSYLISRKIESYTIATLTPSQEVLAAEVLRGVAQAQNEINASPELIKKKGLKVIIDYKDQPEVANSTAQKIADNTDIIAVVGPFFSASTVKALGEYNRRGLVFVSPTSTSEEFSRDCKAANELGDGFCFRTVPSDSVTTRKITNFLFESSPAYRSFHDSLQPVAIFYSGSSEGELENFPPCSEPPRKSDDPYPYSLRKNFCDDLSNKDKGNLKLVVKDFNLRASNFDAGEAVNEAIASGAKTLILFPGDDNINHIKEIITANQKRAILIGSDSLYSPELLGKETGEYLVGSPHPFLFVSPWVRPSSPNNSAFLQSAKTLWQTFEVSWVTATSYDATRILASAFEKMPTQNRTKGGFQGARDAVRKELVKQQLTEGATGKVSFDPNTGNRKEETSQFVIVKCSLNAAKTVRYTFSQFNSEDSQGDRCQ
ncbi:MULTISPECIES: ABC transporter substrate-binding protein [Trichocoleus]|uniref:ABC transporter substrate-binding protein n=1 Tax=Trichocoleus desertorum GB2-A4 TaxID=2933944 RepID=A0ABV0JEN8_9CYAN|nr:ABC transporter substrate-binding protein [Trichocoleus sp. FACHB-46]MBD1862399.1 ABC transporter substrate-binding protein [Trichocoleus sp. FACHB-46]